MAGNRWDSRGGDDGGIKTDKDLGEDFKKASEPEQEPQPATPDKDGTDESKDGTDQPAKENNPPGPAPAWDRQEQKRNPAPGPQPKKSGPGMG